MARLGRTSKAAGRRMPGGPESMERRARTSSWEPLRIERVCEVKYDHLQGDRFRHAAVFRALASRQAAAAIAATTSSRSRRRYELAKVFGAGA